MAASAAPKAPAAPKIAWHRCDEPSQRKLGLQCATVPVPLDHAEPNGPRILLDLARHRASGSAAARKGSLFVNPGGPGGSAINHMDQFLTTLGPSVTSRFDIVAMDPRGVGDSSVAACWSITPEPDVPADGDRSPAQARIAIAHDTYERTACAKTGRPIIDHMSTGDVARDLDLMRRAVGDEKLTYYGVSYGTVLAQTYAAMFPQNVRALALDGVVNAQSWTTGHGGGKGADETLRAAFAACRAAGPKRCPHGATIAAEWDDLLARLAKGPVTTADGTLSRGEVLSSVLTSLYDPDTIAPMMDWIHADYLVVTGKRRTLAPKPPAPAEAKTFGLPGASKPGPVITGHEPMPDAAKWWDTFKQAGVMCSDSLNPSDPNAWTRYADASAASSWFTPTWTWNSSLCAGWPGHSTGVYRGPFTVKPAHPLLVVGNTHDPATPLTAARSVAAASPGARLLTVDAYGHTGANKSTCAADVVRRYLIDGTLPRAGATCVADKPLF